jgi:hypothetical protein
MGPLAHPLLISLYRSQRVFRCDPDNRRRRFASFTRLQVRLHAGDAVPAQLRSKSWLDSS